MPNPGTLYLIPVPIAEGDLSSVPPVVTDTARSLRHFIVEDEKAARKHLKLYGYTHLPHAQLQVLNEHTPESEVGHLLRPLLDGHHVGLMSDAGCPGVADPGAAVVRLCHQRGIRVVPFAGPSSILLSVMASGFNGQSFAFVGYLPVDRQQRVKRLRELEALAARTGQAQFFIETPYRNQQMLEAALAALQADTLFYVGCDLGAAGSFISARTVRQWKGDSLPALHKRAAVFGIFG